MISKLLLYYNCIPVRKKTIYLLEIKGQHEALGTFISSIKVSSVLENFIILDTV
jgi:hypothetical protein